MDYTVESLAVEQQDLLLAHFDYDFAWRLGSLMRERAARDRLPVTITIDHGADLIFSVRLPGATPHNSHWAARKRNVSRILHRSSLSLLIESRTQNFDFNARYRLSDDYAAGGGGVPLILRNGVLVGTVGVSGLPDVDDHILIVEALRSLRDQT
jgi:uncharacterized protein (UPF0303 family)